MKHAYEGMELDLSNCPWRPTNRALVPTTKCRAGHAILTKSDDLPGGTSEGAAEYPLAAAEQVFCHSTALAVVAVG